MPDENGFGNTSAEVARSLPYTNGAMLGAAREAIRNGVVAVAPVAGFHHAGYASVEGYCTFNGLMVTALALKAQGLASRVGILDFDMHYGNGTDEIISKLGAWTWIEHYTAGKNYCYVSQATEFLTRIPRIVKTMSAYDVILYQAGADPHVADPLGGWLTTPELRTRDRIVFDEAKKRVSLLPGISRVAINAIQRAPSRPCWRFTIIRWLCVPMFTYRNDDIAVYLDS